MGDLHDRLGIAACLLDALLSGVDLLTDRVDFPAEPSGLEQTSVVKGERTGGQVVHGVVLG